MYLRCSYGCGSHGVPVKDKDSPSVTETEDQPDVSVTDQSNKRVDAHIKE